MNALDKMERQHIVIENTIKQIKKQNPDRIVIVGDLFHDFIKVNNEAKQLAGYFLNQLSKITKVIITQGNHDLNMKSINRTDSIKVVVDLLNNPNILYLNTTSFYEDENVVYAVNHHCEKTSPYVKYPDYKTNNIIIDLYHNPICGSVNFFGQKFEDTKYLKLSDFKGDLLFLGDIHQYQEFYYPNKTVKGLYPSSLYQNNFGESVDKHGFVLWNIEDKTFKHIEVENQYSFINYYLDGDIDYDNISIELKESEVKDITELKIHWMDKPSEINNSNWRKITTYLKAKYGNRIVKIRKKTQKILDGKIQESNFVKDTITNITNNVTQQEIFKEYLASNGYDEDVIRLVLDLDNIITERLNIHTRTERKDWRMMSFYIDNFRSHGDRFDICWDKDNGIYQIRGENAVGKTNMLSAILYLFYGKTLETLKKEANGDNRFINNKRDLDYCEVGATINIDEQIYNIVRRTERKWDKTKTIVKSTPTSLTINLVDYNGNEINETDEQKAQTQKIIENILGDFEDFLSLYLVNADTLNNLLSVDESKFMDTILGYSGLDIFSKKLEEYKEYKKTKKSERIVLEYDTELANIEKINSDILVKEEQVSIIQTEIIKINERIEKGVILKDNEIRKLHKLDEKLICTSIETVKEEYANLNSKKELLLNKEKELIEEISKLRDTYNVEKYNMLISVKDELNNKLLESKNKYKNYEQHIINTNDKIAFLTKNIQTNTKNIVIENSNIDKEIENLKQQCSLNEKEIEIVLKNIDNQISNIEKEIELLECSKTCPSCGQELKKENILTIQDKIQDKKNSIELLKSSKNNNAKIEIIKAKNVILNNQIDSQKNDKFDAIYDNISKYANENITNENEIFKCKESIEHTTCTLENINTEIENIQHNISKNTNELEEYNKEKIEYDKRIQLMTNLQNVPTLKENLELKIENNIKLHDSILNELEKQKENIEIQTLITKYENALHKLQSDLNEKNNELGVIKNSEIVHLKNKIITINERIEKFKQQEKDDLIQKIYTDCIHRDGLPKILLLRMRDEINNQIETLIGDICNFNLYFDENMSLKMYTCDNNEAVQNVIGGSGMERTFISIVLRLALREINNMSLGNFLFLDEITGKLVGESVTNFFELLHKIKEKIDKIVIIEHAYSDELQVDYSIEIVADEKGVSKIIM
jgi:DNA repair exonuclease SbcCD ATPase subunit/DNA repair exonuclease SbcCD nuclease subunit